SFPSVDTIQAEARLKARSTVQRALRGLEDRGAIERTGEGPKGQSRWTVRMGPHSEAGRTTQPPGAASTAPGGAASRRPNRPLVKPSKEPSVDSTALFEEWKRVFDRADARFSPARQRAVARALDEEPEVEALMQAIRGFKVHRERKPGPIELGDIFGTYR